VDRAGKDDKVINKIDKEKIAKSGVFPSRPTQIKIRMWSNLPLICLNNPKIVYWLGGGA
jgi:hypothetical protein